MAYSLVHFPSFRLHFHLLNYVEHYFNSLFASGPGLVTNLSVPESENSTLLSITWTRPEAGDVDMYQVQLLGEKISIINRTNETSLKINVQYGYHYDVSVSAIFRNLTGDSDRRNSSIGE